MFVSFELDSKDLPGRDKTLQLLEKFKVLSFPNESRSTVYFELCFVTLDINYTRPIQDIYGHQVGLVLNKNGLEDEIFYYDSMKNGGKMLRMDSLRPPPYIKNWVLTTAVYRRL
jgi:hypothetical protein